jgi:adenylate cyclase
MEALLIVDDEEGIRRSLKKVLEKEGYEIYQAENGENAVRIIQEHSAVIDIVISDFKMPGMDGLETLIAIGKINPEITRIILTGYATMESAIESVNSGIDGFLTKPFDNAELRVKVREYHLRKRLKQFVSEQVFMAMRNDRTSFAPRNRKVTILFCDIRGFSQLSGKMSPEEVSRLLDSFYFSPLDNIIFENNGTLDKHIGDGIMGIFGAPLSYGDDALRAVMSAIRMQEEIGKLNRILSISQSITLSIGIGISTGEAMVGIFGSNRKKEYTVFGTTVNLASRLERLAKGGEILICEETCRELANRFVLKKMAPVQLKGMEQEIHIFSVLGASEASITAEGTHDQA